MDAAVPSEYLDAAEAKVLEDALASLDDHPEDRAALESALLRLAHLGAVVREFPSLYETERLAGHHRGPESLVEHLVRRGPFAGPLGLPVRTSLARDFVLAKVQTFRAVEMALEAANAVDATRERVLQEIGQSIYTLLAERLLVEIVIDAEVADATKRRAAEVLVRFWDRCIEFEIDDFAPLLESAWRARNRLVVEFGTLLGSVETIGLLRGAGDTAFLDALLPDDASTRRRQAFEEFLFGLSTEQLDRVREEMRRQERNVVDRGWVAETLGMPEEELFSGLSDPEAVFSSYRTRQLGASFRRLRKSPGPQRTAEFYVMLHILQNG
ncbi:MAG: hypothetical protein QNK04_03945 [Myxococcota bacterium]|nr:hypothetical protein [Myxococcota bacterium]